MVAHHWRQSRHLLPLYICMRQSTMTPRPRATSRPVSSYTTCSSQVREGCRLQVRGVQAA